MRIGLVGCSKLKLPVPAPAWLLYSASPRFSQIFQVARTECDTVRILSAKYGVVEPYEVLFPYDLVLGAMDIHAQRQWQDQVCRHLLTLQGDFVNYCSTQYTRLLTSLVFHTPYQGDLFLRAHQMGRQGKLRRVDWPMHWLLLFLHQHPGVLVARVRGEIGQRGYCRATIDAQIQRIRRCPLYRVQQDRVWSRYRQGKTCHVDTLKNVSL